MSVFEESCLLSPPNELFHYTSQDGLIGIVREKTFRASMVHFLNDSSEFKYAFDLILERVRESVAFKGEVGTRVKTRIEGILQMIAQVTVTGSEI